MSNVIFKLHFPSFPAAAKRGLFLFGMRSRSVVRGRGNRGDVPMSFYTEVAFQCHFTVVAQGGGEKPPSLATLWPVGPEPLRCRLGESIVFSGSGAERLVLLNEP